MKGFLGITVITRVSGLASAFSPNYLAPFFAYCLVGRCRIGLLTTWFLKLVHATNRGIWMIIFSAFWSLGTIFKTTQAWVQTPASSLVNNYSVICFSHKRHSNPPYCVHNFNYIFFLFFKKKITVLGHKKEPEKKLRHVHKTQKFNI